MGVGTAVLHQGGDDVVAEIVPRIRVLGIGAQQVAQVGPFEDVDAHGRQGHVRVIRGAGRVGGLFEEVDDLAVLVDIHHTESTGLLARDRETSDGDIRAGVDMLLEHDLVVHLVDVVAGENDDVLHPVAVDDVDVLGHRISGTHVPFRLFDALAGGEDVEELIALGTQEVPSALHVPDQGVGLVLRGHGDAADARVHRIRQCEIDDAGLVTEVHRRFRTTVGELLEATAAAPGETKAIAWLDRRGGAPIRPDCGDVGDVGDGLGDVLEVMWVSPPRSRWLKVVAA